MFGFSSNHFILLQNNQKQHHNINIMEPAISTAVVTAWSVQWDLNNSSQLTRGGKSLPLNGTYCIIQQSRIVNSAVVLGIRKKTGNN